MPGAGTDKTKRWIETPAPVVILVEPQLGDNIGAAARAMANFGLSRLRLVKPRDGWPNPRAWVAASGADRVLEQAELYDTVEAAIADLTFVLATTARAHDQAKPVVSPEEAARLLAPRVAAGERRRRPVRARAHRAREPRGRARRSDRHAAGQSGVRVAQPGAGGADRCLRMVQATSGGVLPFAMPQKSAPATREQLLAFFANLERELERVEYFRPADKRETMLVNLRNIFHRMQATRQDIQTLQGVIMAIAEGRKGPARGGVLDGSRRNCCARCSPSTPEIACRTSARRCAGWRGCSAAIRPRPSASVGCAHQGPPLCRQRLQAADADRPAHRGLRVVSAARRGRPGAGGGERGGGEGARGPARLAHRARLSALCRSRPAKSKATRRGARRARGADSARERFVKGKFDLQLFDCHIMRVQVSHD